MATVHADFQPPPPDALGDILEDARAELEHAGFHSLAAGVERAIHLLAQTEEPPALWAPGERWVDREGGNDA